MSVDYNSKAFQEMFLDTDENTNVKFVPEKVITIENALEMLQSYIKTKDKEKKKDILEYVGTKFLPILKSKHFLTLEIQTLKEILQIDRVSDDFAGEMEVFDAVMKYFNENTHPPEIIREILKLVRFPTMRNFEFVECLNKCGNLLTDNEKFEILVEISGGAENKHGFMSSNRIFEKRMENNSNEIIRFLSDWKLEPSFHYYNNKVEYVTDVTTLRPSRPITIAHVHVTVLRWVKCNIRAQLRSEWGNLLSSGCKKEVSWESMGGNPIEINFFPSVELIPGKRYLLHVNYEPAYYLSTFQLFKREVSLPYSEDNDGIEITFHNISPLIREIGVQAV